MLLEEENSEMEMFNQNSFLDHNDANVDEEREQTLLAQLKAKIELRRRQQKKLSKKAKVSLDHSLVSETNTHVTDEKEDLNNSHATLTEESEITESINNETSGVSDQVTDDTGIKKKKKKRKRKLSSSDDEETEIAPPEPEADISTGDSFTVLGVDHFEKKQKVKRVLPQWLAKPSVISVNLQQLTMGVDEIKGIDSDIIQQLKENSITHFFPVQCQVIPWLLSTLDKPIKYWPQDVCVSAPTGSGKTLAFVIPVIQALKRRVVPHIRAVAVLPSQELAIQVMNVFKTYCAGTNLRVALTTGKRNFQREQQYLIRKSIVSGPQSLVDIVVTTPGRLVDHIKFTPGFSLQHLRFLIIDEADRVMENIDNDWLYYVNKHIQSFSGLTDVPRLDVETLNTFPPPPQKLLFSATLSQDPEKLQQLGLFQPKLFTSVVEGKDESKSHYESRGDFVGKYTTPAELSEKICTVTPMNKPLVLYHLIRTRKMRHVLCFTNSQVEAHRLSILLSHLAQGEVRVAEISAALSPNERRDILAKFREEKIEILVSTNSLARGIDISIVDYVISYTAQRFIKNYIHQVGRTGRAGRMGTAISFVLDREKNHFLQMISDAGKSIDEELQVTDEDLQPYLDNYHKAIEDMKHDLEREKVANIVANKEKKRSRKGNKKKKGQKHRLQVANVLIKR